VLPETVAAPIEIELPIHIDLFEITDAAGRLWTVIVTESVLVHPLEFVSVKI